MGVAHIRNCSAQPTNPFSLPVWLDFRRNEQAFQQYKMYCYSKETISQTQISLLCMLSLHIHFHVQKKLGR